MFLRVEGKLGYFLTKNPTNQIRLVKIYPVTSRFKLEHDKTINRFLGRKIRFGIICYLVIQGMSDGISSFPEYEKHDFECSRSDRCQQREARKNLQK